MPMHLCDRARLLGAATVVFLLAAAIASAVGVVPIAEASPPLQGTTTVAITPASVELQCGETQVVDIRINDVTDLYGADVRVTYDPSVVEVVDANPTAPGVQIEPGDRPDVSGGQGLVQVNSVDVDTGTISYAAIRLNPAPAQSGNGVIASVTFRGKADGTSPVTLVSVVLSDESALPIDSIPVNGQIEVTCDGTAVPPTDVPPTGVAPTETPVVPPPTAPPSSCTHIVRPGDTLYSIAARYGVSVTAIMQANGIKNPDRIFVGQTLVIPGCTPGPVTPIPPKTPPPSGACTHVVKPGETLFGIARMYGTTVGAIQQANGIADPNRIFAGQTLAIPGCAPGPKPPPPPGKCYPYVVRPGDTLSGIAMRTGDCVAALAHRNGIVNPNLIFVGQRITVCPGCSGVVPGPTPPACRAVHMVRPYETLYRIALMYGSSVPAIQAANNIANPNLIFVGQQLCIP